MEKAIFKPLFEPGDKVRLFNGDVDTVLNFHHFGAEAFVTLRGRQGKFDSNKIASVERNEHFCEKCREAVLAPMNVKRCSACEKREKEKRHLYYLHYSLRSYFKTQSGDFFVNTEGREVSLTKKAYDALPALQKKHALELSRRGYTIQFQLVKED